MCEVFLYVVSNIIENRKAVLWLTKKFCDVQYMLVYGKIYFDIDNKVYCNIE